MNSFYAMNKLFARSLFSLFIASLLLLGACSNKTKGIEMQINLERSQKKRISLPDFCDSIKLFPLQYNNADSISYLQIDKFSVSDGGIFILENDGKGISRFDYSGNYMTSIKIDSTITDFYVTGDKALDILSGNKFYTYDLSTMSFDRFFEIDDLSYSIFKIARRINDPYKHSDVVVSKGYNLKGDFTSEYYLSDSSLFVIDSQLEILHEFLPIGESYGNFFSCNDTLYFQYAGNGSIWRYSAFFSPKYQWKVSTKRCDSILFKKAQMSERDLYMQIYTPTAEYIAVIDKELKNYYSITELRDGKIFPLGSIWNNSNYFICNSQDLHKYLDDRITESYNFTDRNPVVIQYFLH